MNIMHIVSIVCFALCLFIFFYLKWDIKKRTSASGLKEHRIEVAKLIAEINAVTDRDLQLIEDRVIKLKSMLETVDKRIALYEKDMEEFRQKKPEGNQPVSSLYTNLGRGIRSALETPASAQVLQTEHPFESRQLSLALHSSSSKDIQDEQIKASAPAKPKKTAAQGYKEAPPSKKQIRSHIDMMLNEGISAEEIASKLEISIAEVNLAVKLRRKK